ncbi:hypothetical protein [Methylophaga sp. UBA2689]|uniref:hypothetical protein n=1 Tax=Methylophaga sp. UBA2689 TaxID=1946878 RepID=UPI0025F6F71E|nr:hypothetical protein [Methylophaga sp. UBA2689]|tara:strand:+ start:406 stop:621 length:216 start_codon:yes stop_codon:yes gene_type:complete
MKDSASTTSDVSKTDYTHSYYNVQASTGTEVKKDKIVTAYSTSMTTKFSNNQTRKEKNLQNLNAFLRKAGL